MKPTLHTQKKSERERDLTKLNMNRDVAVIYSMRVWFAPCLSSSAGGLEIVHWNQALNLTANKK